MKLSKQSSKPDRITAGIMPNPRRNLISYQPKPIWVQDAISKRWNPGTVKAQAETPHSYIIQTPQGEYRRNYSHLKEAAIPTTVPEPENTTYNTKVPLQPVQGNVYTKPLSPIKEPPSSNERKFQSLQLSVPLHCKVFQQWKRSKSKNPEDHPGYQNYLNST